MTRRQLTALQGQKLGAAREPGAEPAGRRRPTMADMRALQADRSELLGALAFTHRALEVLSASSWVQGYIRGSALWAARCILEEAAKRGIREEW
jgi:hypothetical protein